MSEITAIIMPFGKGRYALEFFSAKGDWLLSVEQDVQASFDDNLNDLIARGHNLAGLDVNVVRKECSVASRQLFPHLYTK